MTKDNNLYERLLGYWAGLQEWHRCLKSVKLVLCLFNWSQNCFICKYPVSDDKHFSVMITEH